MVELPGCLLSIVLGGQEGQVCPPQSRPESFLPKLSGCSVLRPEHYGIFGNPQSWLTGLNGVPSSTQRRNPRCRRAPLSVNRWGLGLFDERLQNPRLNRLPLVPARGRVPPC